MTRGAYPTDVSDDEWSFVSPYVLLLPEDAVQRKHDLREVFNALRWIVRAGAAWRLLPTNFPPWQIVHQQTQRWLDAGCFENIVHDLRVLLRVEEGRHARPSAAIFDSRTLQSTPEGGGHAGYDGAKRRRGSKVHIAVDTLGHLLALHVTPASQQDRAQVTHLARQVQAATGQVVTVAFVDQGYTGQQAERDAKQHGIALRVIKLPEAKRGFVLLPRRWVVERSFGWAARYRRLARSYERLPETLAGLHFVVFGLILLKKALPLFASTSLHPLVFTTPVGQIWAETYLAKVFRQLMDGSGVPRIRLYDLRHSYASMAYEAGVPLKLISDRMGHENIAFTLQTYVHASDSQRRAAALSAEDLFGPAPGQSGSGSTADLPHGENKKQDAV